MDAAGNQRKAPLKGFPPHVHCRLLPLTSTCLNTHAPCPTDKPAKATAAKGRGRKGGASSQDPSASIAAGERWDWSAYREAVLHGLLQLVRVDAAQLFDAPHEQHPMLRLVLQRVRAGTGTRGGG